MFAILTGMNQVLRFTGLLGASALTLAIGCSDAGPEDTEGVAQTAAASKQSGSTYCGYWPQAGDRCRDVFNTWGPNQWVDNRTVIPTCNECSTCVESTEYDLQGAPPFPTVEVNVCVACGAIGQRCCQKPERGQLNVCREGSCDVATDTCK